MDEGGRTLGRAAQDADDVGRARLIGLDVLRLDAPAAQVVAAGGRDAVGLLELQAAVVHQQAHELGRGQRLFLAPEALAEHAQRQSPAEAAVERGVDGRRGLEVLLHQRRAERRYQQLADLQIAADRDPAPAGEAREDLASVFIADGQGIVLRPVLVVAASEIDRTAFFAYRIHM